MWIDSHRPSAWLLCWWNIELTISSWFLILPFFFNLYEEIQEVALLIPSTLPLPFNICQVSLVAQMVKNLPAIQETWVQSLSKEDPLEKGMTTHSNILA